MPAVTSGGLLWTAIFLAALILLWLTRKRSAPSPNRIESPDDVARALEFLIRRGAHGASARFQVEEDSSRSVIFTKYIVSHGNVGLRGRCAQGPEPVERLTAFRRDLAERGISHVATVTAGEAVVELECRRDVGLGVMFVVLAYQRLFEVKLAEHCVAVFDLVSYFSDVPSLTGIDDTTPLR